VRVGCAVGLPSHPDYPADRRLGATDSARRCCTCTSWAPGLASHRIIAYPPPSSPRYRLRPPPKRRRRILFLHGRRTLVRSPKVAGRSRTYRRNKPIRACRFPIISPGIIHPVPRSTFRWLPVSPRKRKRKRWPITLLHLMLYRFLNLECELMFLLNFE
jgi:hypothetical protein